MNRKEFVNLSRMFLSSLLMHKSKGMWGMPIINPWSCHSGDSIAHQNEGEYRNMTLYEKDHGLLLHGSQNV